MERSRTVVSFPKTPKNLPFEFDALRIDLPANLIVNTTIPSRIIGDSPDPDGHSEWIVLWPTKTKVVNCPGYLSPIPKPVGTPSFEVRQTPNMGLGVFATRDIKRGDLIFSERPLLVSPRNIGVIGTDLPLEKLGMKATQLMVMRRWETLLEDSVGRMEAEDRESFMALANSHKEDGSGPLLGIVRTNAFMMSDLFDGHQATPVTIYGGVTKVGSRINHSCKPNVAQHFSIPSFSFQFTALIDIKAGEQLFYPYCDLDTSKAERHAQLAPYGITPCSCPACTHATPETDALRKEYKQPMRAHFLKVHQWTAPNGGRPRRVAESALDPLLAFREALIGEGMHYTAEYHIVVFLISKFYEKAGLGEKAKAFREEFESFGVKLPVMDW